MNSIENNFVPYQIALDMKSIGFDESCFNEFFRSGNLRYKEVVYSKDMRNITSSTLTNSELNTLDIITAPLYQQAFKFFREEYKLDNWVYKSRDGAYFCSILKGSRYLYPSIEFTSHEEAELACLRKLIEIVQNNCGIVGRTTKTHRIMRKKELEQFVKDQDVHWEFSENDKKLTLHLNGESFKKMEDLLGEELTLEVDITQLCKDHGIDLEELNFNGR